MPTSLRGRLSRKSGRRKLFDAFTQVASFGFAGIFIVLTLQVAFPDGITALVDDLTEQPQLAQHAVTQEFHAVNNTPIPHSDTLREPLNQDVAFFDKESSDLHLDT